MTNERIKPSTYRGRALQQLELRPAQHKAIGTYVISQLWDVAQEPVVTVEKNPFTNVEDTVIRYDIGPKFTEIIISGWVNDFSAQITNLDTDRYKQWHHPGDMDGALREIKENMT